MTARVTAVAVALGLLLIALGAFGLIRREDHGAAPATGRTVIVAAGDARLPETPFYNLRDCLGNPTRCVNGAAGIVLTYRVSGETPGEPVTATVVTDENCEPDRFGVSHCLNRLELDGGGVVTVRHDHKMGNDPCLAPGERVVVRPL